MSATATLVATPDPEPAPCTCRLVVVRTRPDHQWVFRRDPHCQAHSK